MVASGVDGYPLPDRHLTLMRTVLNTFMTYAAAIWSPVPNEDGTLTGEFVLEGEDFVDIGEVDLKDRPAEIGTRGVSISRLRWIDLPISFVGIDQHWRIETSDGSYVVLDATPEESKPAIITVLAEKVD